MSVRVTKSITWLWVASLFIATVGVSGQQIYCYCMGKTTFSLFVVDDSCDARQQMHDKSCCSAPSKMPVRTCCKGKSVAEKQGCTKKTTKVFQLKTEFTAQKTVESLPELSMPMDIEALPFLIDQTFAYSESVDLALLAQPPPPLSGRMICVRHGVFRC